MRTSLQTTTAPTGTSPTAAARAASRKASAIQNESSTMVVSRHGIGAGVAIVGATTDHYEFTHERLTEQQPQPGAARQACRPCRGHPRYARSAGRHGRARQEVRGTTPI